MWRGEEGRIGDVDEDRGGKQGQGKVRREICVGLVAV